MRIRQIMRSCKATYPRWAVVLIKSIGPWNKALDEYVNDLDNLAAEIETEIQQAKEK